MATSPSPPTPSPLTELNGVGPLWLRATVMLGVPSVIALFLVYVLSDRISMRISNIEQLQVVQAETLSALAKAQVEHQADAEDARAQIDRGVSAIKEALLRLCLAMGRTAEDRAKCVI